MPARERRSERCTPTFCVPKEELAAAGYDLSYNRYTELVVEDFDHRQPTELLAELAELEAEIQAGMRERAAGQEAAGEDRPRGRTLAAHAAGRGPAARGLDPAGARARVAHPHAPAQDGRR